MKKRISDDHIPISRAATEYSIPYPTLYCACRDRVLPSIKGKRGRRNCFYVTRDDLQVYLNNTRKLPADDCPSVEMPEPEATAAPLAQTETKIEAQVVAAAETNASVEPTVMAVVPIQAETPMAAGQKCAAKKDRKKKMESVKNAMRHFTPTELIRISIWINGRLQREFDSEPGIPSIPAGKSA